MGYTTPNFDKMLENPVARQIPWDDDPKILEAWKNAQTGEIIFHIQYRYFDSVSTPSYTFSISCEYTLGYPYIDAVMTQLEHTGWIHHLARHSVACFLTRGDLWQSW